MAGVLAEGSGFGTADCGSTVLQQRTTNLTIKENSECAKILAEEFKKHLINRAKISNSLDKGWNDQILCAAGIIEYEYKGKLGFAVSITRMLMINDNI